MEKILEKKKRTSFDSVQATVNDEAYLAMTKWKFIVGTPYRDTPSVSLYVNLHLCGRCSSVMHNRFVPRQGADLKSAR